jgi:hypothetical protein
LSNIKISSLPKCSYSREYIKRSSAEPAKVLYAQNGPLWQARQQAAIFLEYSTFEVAFSFFHGQKNDELYFCTLYCSVRSEKLINKKARKITIQTFENFFGSK